MNVGVHWIAIFEWIAWEIANWSHTSLKKSSELLGQVRSRWGRAQSWWGSCLTNCKGNSTHGEEPVPIPHILITSCAWNNTRTIRSTWNFCIDIDNHAWCNLVPIQVSHKCAATGWHRCYDDLCSLLSTCKFTGVEIVAGDLQIVTVMVPSCAFPKSPMISVIGMCVPAVSRAWWYRFVQYRSLPALIRSFERLNLILGTY